MCKKLYKYRKSLFVKIAEKLVGGVLHLHGLHPFSLQSAGLLSLPAELQADCC